MTAFGQYEDDDSGSTCKQRDYKDATDLVVQVVQPVPFDTTQITSPSNYSRPKAGDPCHPLAAGAHPPAIALVEACAPTIAFHPTQDPISSVEVTHALGTGSKGRCATAAVATEVVAALTASGRGVERTGEARGQDPVVAYTEPKMAVRRLLPVECERLQGFHDGWTAIPWKGKPASECPDGPRYKAMGNSMAVPVMSWIGRRLDAVARGES